MSIYSDNQVAIFLVKNVTFHERTYHIEVDYYAICHRVLNGFIITHVGSSHQLAAILTKRIGTTSYDSISRKLGLFDLYAPT